MPHAHQASRAGDAPQILLAGDEVEIRAPRTLGPRADASVRRLLERVLTLAEVASIRIDRAAGVAYVRPQRSADRRDVLTRLSGALRSEPSNRPRLPRAWASSCTIHRNDGRASTCEVLIDQPGLLRLRHPRLKEDRLAARECQRRVAAEPGVKHVCVEGRTGTLNVRGGAKVERMIEVVEESLDAAGWWDRESPPPPRASFALSNANLAVGAAADLAAPGLGVVCATILVGGNLKTFRQAVVQVQERRAGLPVLYTVIVGGTLATGNFLASALMAWSFKYWQDRLRVDLSAGRRRLLAECLPMPSVVQVDRGSGTAFESPDRLLPGDLVRLGPGDAVPADGRVASGRGLVDQCAVRGLRGASRVDAGDELLAGGRVLHGTLALEVSRPSADARAAAVGRALVGATNFAPDRATPRDAEAFAERAVGPTIVAAGVGLMSGGLDVATAVLRPDYATGPGMVGPLESLRNAAACARIGVVVRSPDAFGRLAGIDRLVLDDFPELHRPGVRVASVQSELPQELVLRYAAAAFRHMADDRSTALEDACRSRGGFLLDLAPLGFDDGVTVAHGKHRVVVRDQGEPGVGRLTVEIDGRDAGSIAFERSDAPAAAGAVARLRRRLRIPVAFISSRPTAEAERMGRALGVDATLGGLTSADKARLMQDLRTRGRPMFVGDCTAEETAARSAFAAVCISGEVASDHSPASAVLMRPELGLLAEALSTARSQEEAGRSARRFVLVPGVMCVAGAMFFGVTSLAVVVVNNLGTLQLYRRAAGSTGEVIA
ncbi:P-type ATPase [Paludisphaera rhizosphaerae]|uniref:P-type ATPase n=1 Tax=Paludisphaera rhizosphaerae TaxID=2711216 RepID=UPI0013EC02FA|nr:hypothetical protein [Paludisphaera rhizosphaerae]